MEVYLGKVPAREAPWLRGEGGGGAEQEPRVSFPREQLMWNDTAFQSPSQSAI